MSLTEIIVSIAGVFGSIVVAYLAYRRGTKADDDAQENIAIGKVYEGYGTLLEKLQAANDRLEAKLELAYQRIDKLEAELEEIKKSK